MKRAQEELASIEVEGQSGAAREGGHDLQARRQARDIDPSLLADDKDMSRTGGGRLSTACAAPRR